MVFNSGRRKEDAMVIVEGKERDEDVLRLERDERIDTIIITPGIEKIVVRKEASNLVSFIGVMLSLVNIMLLLILVALMGGLI